MALGHFVSAGDLLIDRSVLRLDCQLAALAHRIARIDGEIQHRALQLHGIGEAAPDAGALHRFDTDMLAQRTRQQFAHRTDEFIHVDRARLQRLLPRERQQTLRQRRGARRAIHRSVHIARHGGVASLQPALHQVQRSDHHSQHIVEVVRDAAGEVAYGLHFLRLA